MWKLRVLQASGPPGPDTAPTPGAPRTLISIFPLNRSVSNSTARSLSAMGDDVLALPSTI